MTAAMEFGSLVHEVALEPDDFAARLETFASAIVLPEGNGNTKEIKEARASLRAVGLERGQIDDGRERRHGAKLIEGVDDLLDVLGQQVVLGASLEELAVGIDE